MIFEVHRLSITQMRIDIKTEYVKAATKKE